MAEPERMNFCPTCGKPLSDSPHSGKMRRTCPACGFIHFADPKVAAVVFITQGQRMLLVRRAVDPEKGKWSMPGGFIDYGEDPREAAIREVREETGLKVTIRRLVDVLGPEPDRTPKIITILFEAEISDGSPVAGDDAGELQFFTPGNAPVDELAFDSTRMMVRRWLAAFEDSR